MAFQFVHMAAYSRKGDGKGRSTGFVFGEARRDPGASVHVANPSPPVVVFGVGVDEVERLHDATADAATTIPKGGKPRKIQKSQHTLMTVVASHPHTMEEVRADPERRREAEEWENRTVAWLRSQYGDKLVSVVRHEDESHYHLHAYVLPDDPAMRASALHPGQTAKAAIMAAGPVDGEDSKALNKRGDASYRSAMRSWQDSYYEAVGIPCGLARLGPQRRRLTRDQWHAEQVQAKALKATIERAQAVKARGESFVASTKEDVAAIREEAAAVQAEAARQLAAAKTATAAALSAQDKAVAEQRKARSMMTRVREEAARVREATAKLQRLPGALRSLFDGFKQSKVADRIRAAVEAEIEGLRRTAADAADRATAASTARQEAEQRAKNLRANLTDTARELAAARQELAALRPPEPDRAPGISTPVLRRR
ncbi:plasmid recombination protein [Neorhizobium galegae]|uniref:plasmid recombination protein n=1 Tax=Neorhizobium galegae TaxID=399 RepID=UPI002107B615|nr:plasmid recombination protein [Neorhizobium galegae]MCQ1770361.1 plasmid recombination protein [Neorhizobium galegae]MCQ1799682.1 plasmid recombination protein [Neorhizobium galegae]